MLCGTLSSPVSIAHASSRATRSGPSGDALGPTNESRARPAAARRSRLAAARLHRPHRTWSSNRGARPPSRSSSAAPKNRRASATRTWTSSSSRMLAGLRRSVRASFARVSMLLWQSSAPVQPRARMETLLAAPAGCSGSVGRRRFRQRAVGLRIASRARPTTRTGIDLKTVPETWLSATSLDSMVCMSAAGKEPRQGCEKDETCVVHRAG